MASVNILADTAQIVESSSENPNVLTFTTLEPDTVHVGNEVLIESGDYLEVRHFGGLVTAKRIIKNVDDVLKANITVSDYSWLMAQTTIAESFIDQTPSQILANIIALVGGISLGSVDLPNDPISMQFDGTQTCAEAASRVCREAGGRWKVSYYRVFSAFVTDPAGACEAVDLDHTTMKDLALDINIQNQFNRVYVEGVGTTAIYDQKGAALPVVWNEAFAAGDGGPHIVSGYKRTGGNLTFVEPLLSNTVPVIRNTDPGLDSGDPTIPGGLPADTYFFVFTATTDLGETHYTGPFGWQVTPDRAPCGIALTWYFLALGGNVFSNYGTWKSVRAYMANGADALHGSFFSVGEVTANNAEVIVTGYPDANAATAPDPTDPSTARIWYVDGGSPQTSKAGDPVNVEAMAEDTGAQAAFAALFPFAVNPVVSIKITDNTLGYPEALARAEAELARGKAPEQHKLTYDSYDGDAHPGRPVAMNYPGVGAADFVVDQTTITFERTIPQLPPRVRVDAVPAANVRTFRIENSMRYVASQQRLNRRAPQLKFATLTPPAVHTAAPTAPVSGWDEQNLPSTGNDLLLNDINYGAGLLVAVGQRTSGTEFQRVVTSSDGVTWTMRNAALAQSWQGVCYASTLALWCAVSANGGVMTSPDGITWTSRTPAQAGKGWSAVCWAPSLSLFIAVASNNVGGSSLQRVQTSPDGLNWTVQNAAAAYTWQGIVWAPSLGRVVVTAGGGGADRVMTSTDGVNWTLGSLPVSSAGISGGPSGVVIWSPALSLFLAIYGAANSQQAFTSPDGLVWTQHNLPGDGVTIARAWNAGAWSPELNKFVVMGESGNGTTIKRIITSDDGINWTAESDGNAGFRARYAVAWSPTASKFVGTEGTQTDIVVVGVP